MKIFINPGHCPGIDPGAVNSNWNMTEAESVEKIGYFIYRILKSYGHDVRVVQSDNLAGESGGYLTSVCGQANGWPADLFISLHCNAAMHPNTASGTETFFHRMSPVGYRLAKDIQRSLVEALGLPDRGTKDGSQFIVLKDTSMPAVLVEILFIDNDADCQNLYTKPEVIAQAIADAINNFKK